MAGMDLHEIVVDQAPARWHERGEGPPVVFLHGVPTSPRLWRHVMPLVRGRSLAWEMLGYGESIPDGKGQQLGLAAQADRLVRWLDAMEIESATLVGHDLGGGVAQIAAVRHPDRVSGLVLTNAVCYDSWPIPSVRAMRKSSAVLRHMPQVGLYPAFVQLIHRGHDNSQRARESLGVHWQPYVTHGAAPSLMRQVDALDVEDTLAIADRLPTLDLPARVVWGAADRFQKIGYGERLAADLGAALHPIRGGKHFTPEDHPDVVATAVNEVVDANG